MRSWDAKGLRLNENEDLIFWGCMLRCGATMATKSGLLLLCMTSVMLRVKLWAREVSRLQCVGSTGSSLGSHCMHNFLNVTIAELKATAA